MVEEEVDRVVREGLAAVVVEVGPMLVTGVLNDLRREAIAPTAEGTLIMVTMAPAAMEVVLALLGRRFQVSHGGIEEHELAGSAWTSAPVSYAFCSGVRGRRYVPFLVS